MKKVFGRLFTLLILLSLLVFPLQCVQAQDSKYFDISSYNMNVNVNKDGSADIEEILTYNFQGEFNGILRDVDFSRTNEITNQKVYVVKNGTLSEVKLGSDKSLSDGGQVGTYNFVKEGELAKFKIFEPSINEEKTFIIRYKLLNVATKYNDTAEFNRKLIDINWQVPLNNIYIKIILPEGASTDSLKVFAHGPLTGESRIIDGRTVELSVANVNPGTFVETLVLFPAQLIPQSQRIISENALPRILQNESNLADEANRIREEARQQIEHQVEQARKKEQLASLVGGLGGILVAIWLFIIFYLYNKYDKELKPTFQGKYFRELPGEYTPAEASTLMYSGTPSKNTIMATLMDLVRKEQFILTSYKSLEKGLFSTKEVDDYEIALNEKRKIINLKTHEEFLIDWFIGKIGDGRAVTLKAIKNYTADRKEALNFKADYDTWNNKIIDEYKKNNFIDETTKKGNLIGVLTAVIYILISVLEIFLGNVVVGILLLFLGIIMFIFGARIKRRTAYGNEQYAMWEAFRRFLKDFSSLNKAEIPSIVLWEHYLVYAIALGVAKDVLKQLPLVFKEDELNDPSLIYMNGMRYGYFVGLSHMLDTTMESVEKSISSAESIANSANSSSSGGGGGFSGGSSGGGGGGGGGGAF